MDINVVDVSGCKPVTDAYVELWGCNATGVYTGVQAKGNGDGSSAMGTNALRGVQPTQGNGTATFTTVIPGHYVGRANHLHSKQFVLSVVAYTDMFQQSSTTVLSSWRTTPFRVEPFRTLVNSMLSRTSLHRSRLPLHTTPTSKSRP